MGEIKTVVQGDLTMMKAIGSISLNEVIDALEEFYSSNTTKLVAWDLTSTSAAQLNTADIEQIAKFVRSNSHVRAGGRTAIIAPNDLEFGIGRMLDVLSEIHDVQLAVATFRKFSDAAKWLGVESLPCID